VNSLLSLRALGVFFAAILVDISWGYYIRRAGAGKPISAANWAVCIMLFGVFNTLSWLNNRWMLLPLYLGSWIGTYSVVKWDHRNKSVPNA
jgi:hypothetical protein